MILLLILLIVALILLFLGLASIMVGYDKSFWDRRGEVLVLLGTIAVCLSVVLMLYAGALALPKTYSNATYMPIPIPIFLK